MTSGEFQEKKQQKLKVILIKTVLSIVTLSFILFSVSLAIYKIFHTLLERDIEMFLKFFKESTTEKERINADTIFFKDFESMVIYANNMIQTIKEQQESLHELNQKLEDKVRIKTADLEKINQTLIAEKNFSQELLLSQREFLRYTVHETNTPLSVILTSIELFVMKNKKDRQLSKIEAAAKNIFSIYDDLSYLVKKDQIEYPKNVINIGTFLHSRLDFFEEVAQLSKIYFQYISCAKNFYIYFNETKLQRIIDNTITNAIKYTLANEKVFVELKEENTFISVSFGSKSKEIKDTKKIFDSFYREEKHREGFGIGLRLVKTICDEEGVEIFIDSSSDKTIFNYKFRLMGD
jgi:signal transduction histidine kinase